MATFFVVKAINFRSKNNNFAKLFLYRLIKSSLFTNKVLKHDFKFRGRTSIVAVGITIIIAISIAIIRRIWPIIVATKIIPISIVVEIIVFNEVHINMLFLSNQRS